ncbi:flagellin [Methanoculleus sp. Wushi-C6]|uniref:Flagellin n=1 Tax=Methanoculleus caldifontis TaxID=2651577 RepID=A0ABU3X3J1_9EURY|nr:archaellin/type IV pilin N-terminal domain-containing protein [Methanoculleus sp. Wushi-C6]MDV2482345.1 flagellin [Methanoculleus sp. Wushi-C6]
MRLIQKDDAFTGLEAAIVLIAFVVVAAVFSYVVLGAGFFTTQKSQEVVHTSVGQASSSVEVIGDVYGRDTDADSKIDRLEFTLGLTAGGSVVDMNSTVLTYTTSTEYKILTRDEEHSPGGSPGAAGQWTIFSVKNPTTAGSVLEKGEQFVMQVDVPTSIDKNEQFTLEVKPATGATLSITRTAPAEIDKINVLY